MLSAFDIHLTCRYKNQFNLTTHQICRQSQPSEFSDAVLGWFGFLLPCGIGL